MNNEELQEKEYTKYLGVIIDNKLNWKKHISQTKIRLSKGIGILYRVRNSVSKSTLRNLFFAFIHSNINYCLLNWGSAPATTLKPIKVSLNTAVRVMSLKDNRYHTNSLYKELNILPLEDCYKLKLVIFMWKIENNKLPHNIISKFQRISHHYNTRQRRQSSIQLPSS